MNSIENSIESFLSGIKGTSTPILIIQTGEDGKHIIKILHIPQLQTPTDEEPVKQAIKVTKVASLSTTTSPSSSRKLDTLKLRQHIWNTLFFPLLSKEDKSSLSSEAPIVCEFNEGGELNIFLNKDYLDESRTDELKARLQLNHRLTFLEHPEHSLAFKVPNHHLLHLFFNNPQLLKKTYNSFPKIKEMHDVLLNGTPIDSLAVTSQKQVTEFQVSSLPGDYIIIKKPDGYGIHYRNAKGVLRAFTFSNKYQSFSSFQGFEHLQRPFLFRNAPSKHLSEMHNAFLHFKYVNIANSLKKYDSNEMCNFSVGGIDAIMDMEDLIAWHEHLPEGGKKTEIFKEILTYFSISFAHFNSLKGQALSKDKKISLEGMRRPVGKAEITECALRYLPRSQLLSSEHREKLYQMWQKGVKYSNKSTKVISNYTGLEGDAENRFNRRNKEILQDLEKGIPVSISTGWSKHTVEITLLSHKGVTYLLYTNKGSTLDKDNHTKLYRVTKPVTEEIISHLRRRPPMGEIGEKKGAYFFATTAILKKITQELKGGRPKTMSEEFGLELIDIIKKVPQKVGNCTVANGKEMMYNAEFLLKFVELLDQELPQEECISQAIDHAYHVHKEQQLLQKVYQISIWKHFTKHLPSDDQELSRRHFEIFQMISTKVVSKKSKVEKYHLLGQTEGSIIPDIFQSLKEAMQELIRTCPCDIEACTGPIAFKAGNRIKRGPNGGFGIYKSKFFLSGSKVHPKFHLAVKNTIGKFEVLNIYPHSDSIDSRYKIEFGKSDSTAFTTLAELAKIMEARDHQMIFAL